MPRISPDDVRGRKTKLTTSACHHDLFYCKGLSFGFTNAAEIYQKYIKLSLERLYGVRNTSDDLIVHGSNQEEHDSHLHSVFERLHEKGLTANLFKFEFGQPSISYFGNVFSSKGVSTDPDKVKAIS